MATGDIGDHWAGWNNYYTVTNGTSSSSTDATTGAWWAWNGTWSTWTAWTEPITLQSQTFQYQPRELTAEERAAETERLRAAAEAARVRQEEARLAVEKAEALLRAHLDDEQQATLDREQAFLVSVKSGRKYKVKRGQRGNVREMDDQGQEVRSFCIHPDDVPDQDAMLAQKLLLEHDEPAFRRIANVTELRLAS